MQSVSVGRSRSCMEQARFRPIQALAGGAGDSTRRNREATTPEVATHYKGREGMNQERTVT